MNHIALYRAWRPQTFGDVVGQRHIIQTLQNSLREGRYTHAYLFSGPRGTGKTSAAKILAKALNCEQGPGPEPCNTCRPCLGITEGSILDVVEIDAASNRGVEEIRDVRDKVKYAPTEVRHKVYIIDEVHMLTTEAFNALLKTLEEPPPHVVFILATTEPGRIPATIVSRCQRFDFRRIDLSDQIARLESICHAEGIQAETAALELLARLSDGGMRDALSMLDQVVSYCGMDIAYRDVVMAVGGLEDEQFAALAGALQRRDIGAVLEQIEQFLQEGKSADKCLESLIYYYRDLLLMKLAPGAEAATERIVNPQQFAPLAESYRHEDIFMIIETLNHFLGEMKYSPQPQMLFEIALMKICAAPSAADQGAPTVSAAVEASASPAKSASDEIERLTRKVSELERRIEQLSTGIASPKGTEPEVGQGRSGGRAKGRASAPGNAGSSRTAATSRGIGRSTQQMASFLQAIDSGKTEEVIRKWSQVLGYVKEQRVTVHAWLVDGEPVAATEDVVLVAFKNTIHRETTEKPANKQLIEQVLADVFGSAMSLETVMMKEWTEHSAAQQGKDAVSTPSDAETVLKLEPEPESQGKYNEEWINEAIELFGEELVTIKDNPEE